MHGMPLLAVTARQRQRKGCALSCRASAGYRDRSTTVTRTSTHCGSPLLMKTRGAYARSKTAGRGVTGNVAGVQEGFRNQFFAGRDGPIAGKPAPTGICGEHTFCVQRRSCGSGLARDGDVTGAAELSWPSPAADLPPTAAHGACHARTASRQSRPRGSAAPTARCRSGHGWPGRSPACRSRPCSAHR